MRTPDRLKDQNNLRGWRDCEAAGLKHRPGAVQYVGWPIVARYTPCTRCPVAIRTTGRPSRAIRSGWKPPFAFGSKTLKGGTT